MSSKTILILTVAVAFVAGTMTSGTMVNAAPNGLGQPFDVLSQQIDDLADELRGVDADLQLDIDAETAARLAADSILQSEIEVLEFRIAALENP